MLPGLPERVHDNLHHFTGRAWLLPRVLDWLENTDDRLFLLAGNPGTGKSMIAAWLAGAGPLPSDPGDRARLQQVRKRVAAVHFCQAASGTTAPKALAENMAEQLTGNVAPFANALAEALPGRVTVINIEQKVGQAQEVVGIQGLRLDLGELGDEPSFNRVLREPLKRLYKGGYTAPMLLVVDALDEAVAYPTPTIPELLARLDDLPPQVRVLATTRPDPQVLYLFPAVVPVDLIADAPQNSDDVGGYVRTRLGLPEAAERAVLGERLARTADGNFLYAHLVLEDLLPRLEKEADLDALPLPADLSELYQQFLNRRLGGVNRPQWSDKVRPVLGLVAVGQGTGLTRGQLDRITGRETEGTLETWKQYLGGALPNGPFRPFHKSFADFLLEDPRNQAYHVEGPRMHEQVVRHYWPAGNGGKPWVQWDAYARRYVPTHLAGAARGRDTGEAHPLVERLVRLVTSVEYQDDYRREVRDISALQADLEQTVRAAAADLDPEAVPLVAEAAFALVEFRRRELRPEPLFALAGQGEIDGATNRLDLFEADLRWRQAALLVLAWLGAGVSPQKARQALDRLPGLEGPLARLASHVEAELGGPPVPPVPLRPPNAELVQELVRRAEGQGVNVELLVHHGHLGTLQDTRGLTTVGYLAKEDAPELVSFAAADPMTGDELFQRYVTTLVGYSYFEYRNQSLWFLLEEAVKHPHPVWVKATVARLASTALSPAGADFREGMWITMLALRAAAGEAASRQAIDQYAADTFAMATQMRPGRDDSRYSDTYGSVKRRLAAFAQTFARLLAQPADASRFLDQALAISDFGFAGFQMPACLSLAESYQICMAGAPALGEAALETARTAAHNVQDATFCARSTARYNAMRRRWWGPGIDFLAAARLLADDAGDPDFAALHVVGEEYDGRREGGLPRPEWPGHARTLRELAELYHRPLADLLRLNHESGWQAETQLALGAQVRIPDRGLATLLTARFAAEVLTHPALDQSERVELIQKLVPVAAANPTALDSVLSRLLLAARPTDPGLLDELLRLADEARSAGATGTSFPFHPRSPG